MSSTFPSDLSTDGSAEPVPETQPAPPADEWAQIFDSLRQRFPGASPGVLFCINKLQQDPELKLRDFKHEAALHGVPLSGRSFHSARVLLGLERPTPRARPSAVDEVEVETLDEPAGAVHDADEGEDEVPARGRRAVRSLRTLDAESPAIAALRRFQAERAADLERLREGIRRALAVIDEALTEE